MYTSIKQNRIINIKIFLNINISENQESLIKQMFTDIFKCGYALCYLLQ